jgi:hypothetical protein
MALRRRDTRDRRNACACRGPQRRRSSAVRVHGALYGEAVVAVGAVVVADEHVGVDVAQADEVLHVGRGARVNAGFVAGDAGVDDAGGVLVGGL